MTPTNETRALAHEILAYWLRFNKHDQEAWVGDTHNITIEPTTLPNGAEVNVCGTTLCAAGTAVFLSLSPADFRWFARRTNYDGWVEEGSKLLGLTLTEGEDVFLSDKKSAKRYMRAIASGSQKKFAKAQEKAVRFGDDA